MPDINVYSTDPGQEVRVSRGAVVNVIQSSDQTPDFSVGVSVLGIIGAPANDRGVPNVPTLLSGLGDLKRRWGSFKTFVGDGAAAGYEGNVAAMGHSLLARRVVFSPVDMALKDLSASNSAAVDVPVTISRGALAFTVEADDDIFTCTGHPFVAGDTFQIVQLADGTGVASFTTYHVIAPVVAAVSFKASQSAGGGSLTVTLDGSGTLVPLSVATPSYDPLVVPAGTRLVRKARTFNITGAEATEILTTDEPHGLVVGETVTIAALTGGAGAAAGEFVVATTPTVSTLTLTAFAFTTDITAGTLSRLAGSFVLRTLEDLTWAEDEYDAKTVRVSSVSGTPCAINKVDGFHADDAAAMTTAAVVVATTAVTVPDTLDAAEILVRYQAAMDNFNVNAVGKSCTVMITDRCDGGTNDALATHCSDATAEGIFRICVVAPPVGTTYEEAVGTGADGAGRATLNGDFAVYVWPGIRRRFNPPDSSGALVVSNNYKATFPGQALLAAKMLNIRPEENPTFVEAEPFVTYGCAEAELGLTPEQRAAAFQAGICVLGSGPFEYRDGIMVGGKKIARKRLEDFLAVSVIERVRPWHKRLASAANQKGTFDSVDTFLDNLKSPRDQRIDSYDLTMTYDGTTEEATIVMDVRELGNQDIFTLMIGVSSRGFTILSAGE